MRHSKDWSAEKEPTRRGRWALSSIIVIYTVCPSLAPQGNSCWALSRAGSGSPWWRCLRVVREKELGRGWKYLDVLFTSQSETAYSAAS